MKKSTALTGLAKTIATGLAIPVLLWACASGGEAPDKGQIGPAAEFEGSAEGTVNKAVKQNQDEVAAVLERAATDPATLRSLNLMVECRGDAGRRRLTVMGSGVGIWQDRRQFDITDDGLRGLVQRLDLADFAAMADLYGGSSPVEDEPPLKLDSNDGVKITCRIELSMGDVKKTSAQRLKGEQSDALRQLADELLAYGEAAGQTGIGADSLTDGLEKIARGQLAPEGMQVMMQQLPESNIQSDRSHGFLMRVQGLNATVQPWTSGKGYAAELFLRLDAKDIRSLAGSLAEAQPEELPGNLYAERMTDVRIKVLNHQTFIQARRFAGKTAATHGEQQRLFDQLAMTLYETSQRVLREGEKADGQ